MAGERQLSSREELEKFMRGETDDPHIYTAAVRREAAEELARALGKPADVTETTGRIVTEASVGITYEQE